MMKHESSPVPAFAGKLRSLLRFRQHSGEIWMGERRVLLLPAAYLRELRHELFATLGAERAEGVLFRMGFEWGKADAAMIRNMLPDASLEEIMHLGPEIHSLEGLVIGSVDRIEIDQERGYFLAEASWSRSWESEIRVESVGETRFPTCYSQTGFASGYVTALLGFPVVFKELDCLSCGAPRCQIVGRELQAWPEDERYVQFMKGEDLTSELTDLREQLARLEERLDADPPRGQLIGVSSRFMESLKLLARAAPSDIAVLLLGETGVGKEAFARWLHDFGPRAEGPFVAVNCGAIPPDLVESELFGVDAGAFTGATKGRPGRFERADGGTIFLDEVGDLPLQAQVKLLRVLQEGEIERLGSSTPKKIDVRVISATNVNLEQAVDNKSFRADLYYRIAGFPVSIAPLRERKADILPLAEAFLMRLQQRPGAMPATFSDWASRALVAYSWPGNVRELQNVVERACLLAGGDGVIGFEHLGISDHSFDIEATLTHDGRLQTRSEQWLGIDGLVAQFGSLDAIENKLVEWALEKSSGRISGAARLLGMTRPQLEYRVKRKYAKVG